MVSLGDIKAARERIRGAIRQTPVLYSEILPREAGNQLFLKLENLNITGSYKERGALNKILTLTADERARGVITASAGNHAQAVAYCFAEGHSGADLHAGIHAAREGNGDASLGRGSDSLRGQF
jgi:threonine dehydratase